MSNQSVLVVDDEIAVLKATAKTIALAGHHVEMASNAEAALTHCESHSFDVVVLDLMMPGVDGLELLARLRRVQPTVKSIIISGKLTEKNAEEEIASRLRQQVEADAYLHKPVTARRILDLIETVCAQSSTTSWKELAAEMVSGTRISLEAAREASNDLRVHEEKK